MTRYALAVAAYILPTFPLGYAWHLVTFADAYERLDLLRPEVIIPLGLAAMTVQGTIFAWLYPRLFSTARADWIKSAAQFAAIFGALAWSFMVLPVAAKYRMASVADFMLLETGFILLQYLVVSPLIALVYRGAQAAPT